RQAARLRPYLGELAVPRQEHPDPYRVHVERSEGAQVRDDQVVGGPLVPRPAGEGLLDRAPRYADVGLARPTEFALAVRADPPGHHTIIRHTAWPEVAIVCPGAREGDRGGTFRQDQGRTYRHRPVAGRQPGHDRLAVPPVRE